MIRRELVHTVDLLPTFLELAGAERPAFIDGRSLTPLFSPTGRADKKWRMGTLVELGPLDRWYRKVWPPAYGLIRTRDYKFIEYETGEREFYDLRVDPNETINLVSSLPEKTVRALSEWLHNLQTCRGQSCRVAEEMFVPVVY